jgi:hypothetical protein
MAAKQTTRQWQFAKQELRKYATVLEPLLSSVPRETIELLLEAVFSMWSAYSTERVQTASAVERSELVDE